MTSADEYRVKAAEFSAKARQELNPALRAQFENFALGYLRLAEQAERNSKNDLVYETPAPPAKPAQPNVQQQQQVQPKPDDLKC